MSNNFIFTTRNLGPNAKGSALTIDELDSSLLFLSSSLITSGSINDLSQSLSILSGSFIAVSQSVVEITGSITTINNELLILSQSISEIQFQPLSGSNYIFVEANGTPTQNGGYLTASYALAKLTIPARTDRFSVLLGPGYYEFNSDFNIDTEYIDVVSLTGDRDVYITGSNTIVIGADNVYVRGIDVELKNFTITSSFPNTIIKNCKGGDESFGGDSTLLNAFTMAGTFIDCEGGDYSFAGNGFAFGTFINCIGGNNSFGNECDGIFTNCVGGEFSFANQGSITGGTLENCTAGDNSFATIGTIDIGAELKRCVGGQNSFCIASGGVQTSIDGVLESCQFIGSNFTLSAGTNGKLINCYPGPGTTSVTYP
jgi:hypothetical protein